MERRSPCAACKIRRRRCPADCIFAPYFPSDEPQKFAVVRMVFGANNGLPVHHRGDFVRSLVYVANARVQDPVNGCLGYISFMENRVLELQMQLGVGQNQVQEELQLMPLGVAQNQVQELELMPLAVAQAHEFDLNQLPPGEDEHLDLDLHL
ncbi:hypothetical protein K1719_045721 [Acacia pycnantha]|nr:hypothetical protein K1719_045721 [Acacia pycnantha]